MTARPEKYIKVFIGRFQPFHNGHLKVLRAAIDTADLVVVVIGSAYRDRTHKNPFTWDERKTMIELSLRPAELAKVAIVPQADNVASDAEWVKSIKAQVREQARVRLGYAKLHITLVGCHKDASSYYLKLYRGWGLDLIPASEALNATDVRNAYFGQRLPFKETHRLSITKTLPPASAAFLYAFWLYNQKVFDRLALEHSADKAAKRLASDIEATLFNGKEQTT